MKKLLAAVAIALLMPFGLAHAGAMEQGGMFGMVSFAGNVTINPSFGYYPAVRADFGIGRFLIAGSVGGVFAGEAPEQVVGLDGAFQLIKFDMPFNKSGLGRMYVYLMGGVTSAQGTYSLVVDGSQYKIGPKVYFDFDGLKVDGNKVSIYVAMPFMTSKVESGTDGLDLQSIKYLAVEGGVSIEL